ncbi:MAG: CHAD domain-containing protein [Trichloromonadaceae bacterium]
MSDFAAAPQSIPVLAPHLPAGAAVRGILLRLLGVLDEQEAGLRAGLDAECLHDFRVAVRRTRSVLGQLKATLPPAVLKRFRPEFAWLGELTSPTRDLDVYLHKFPAYCDWLPAETRDDLKPLLELLHRQRDLARARMLAGLDSERFLQLKSQWRFFLTMAEDDSSPPQALRPLRELTDSSLCRALRKALRDGAAITGQSPAADLHELRKTCKKLRYLLEFFQELYSPKAMGRLIRALKGLQDNLGEFQDLQVHSEALLGFSRQMVEEGEVPPQTLLALGMLVETLRARQQRARKEFNERFAGFASAENRRLLSDIEARRSLVATLNAFKEISDGKLSER